VQVAPSDTLPKAKMDIMAAIIAIVFMNRFLMVVLLALLHRRPITTASPLPPNNGIDVAKPVAVNPEPYKFPYTEPLDAEPM
jgi:hypothetical protein